LQLPPFVEQAQSGRIEGTLPQPDSAGGSPETSPSV
jgi:hypothetical protein